MAKRVARNSPQTRITRRRIICAQTVFPSKHQRYVTRIRGVGCAHCSPIARFGFNASDALISELSDIRPERSLRQVVLKSRDRVLAVERHATCRRFATCRMECLDGADNSSSISQSKAAVLDPEPVVRALQIERLLPPEAAMRLSGSSTDPADDRSWVENGTAAFIQLDLDPGSLSALCQGKMMPPPALNLQRGDVPLSTSRSSTSCAGLS